MTKTTVSPADAAAEILARDDAQASLKGFIAYGDGWNVLQHGVVPAAHHNLLIDYLEAVLRGDIDRLMVLMPPGSAKSTYSSILFPPYAMGRNPHWNILGVSNTTELAEKWSRKVRQIVANPRYRNVFGFSIASDVQAAGNWETERGGEYFAAGMGTGIAGRRADLGLIDDPIRSREEADSELIRDKQWDWYNHDFFTRLKPQARQILIQTRWHEDDLGGRLLEREAKLWTVVKLPWLAVDNDPLGRPPGARLWPEYFTQAMEDKAKSDVRVWNALYQQDPVPDSGDYFKRESFQEYDQTPDGLRIYGASDYAVSEGRGDYTEHGIFGFDFSGCIYILDWWRGQASPDKWIEAQCALIAKWRPVKWFGESGVIRKAVEPFLKRRMQETGNTCFLEWFPSIADKPTRARAFQAKVYSENVFLPRKASWKSDLMGQLMRFPAGKYDDGVDVCSLIGRALESVRPPEADTVKPKPSTSGGLINRLRNRQDGWMLN